VSNLSARYATALFELYRENNNLDELLTQTRFLCDTFQNTDALQVLTHPLISTADKNSFADKIFGGNIHSDLFHFIKLTIAKNRESFLLPALTRLVEMIKLHRNQITAKITSAVPLGDEQKLRLSQTLSARLGKEVDVYVVVDPSLIAGISIHVDGYFLDHSVKTMLKNMNDDLKKQHSN